MIKILTMCATIGLLPSTCDHAMSAKESCKVIKEILYSDGSFSFTPEERTALRRVNKEKIVALKDYYLHHCPQ